MNDFVNYDQGLFHFILIFFLLNFHVEFHKERFRIVVQGFKIDIITLIQEKKQEYLNKVIAVIHNHRLIRL